MYHPYFYLKEKKSNITLKIKYFSLEMSSDEKAKAALCHFMFIKSKGKVRVSPEKLDSQFGLVDEKILAYAETFREEFEEFEKTVEFIDNIRNPFGIYNYMREYARQNGKFYLKGVEIKIPENPNWEDYKFDKYLANNPDEYVIPILDHASLLKTENGGSDFDAIGSMSRYFVRLRNIYKQSPVLIQQQALAKENVEHQKADAMRPSADGLGINKSTSQDCDLLLGLFSPYRHKLTTWGEYVIATDDPTIGLRDNHRELSVIYNRRGQSIALQLYFDGSVNWMEELPPKGSAEMAKMYEVLKERRKLN